MFGRNIRHVFALAALAVAAFQAPAFGQGAILQGGPWTPGHAPMYVGSGQQGAQTVAQDSGPAGGGAVGLGLSELLMVNRSATASSGTGLFGAHDCRYSAPITSAAYYYLCFDPSAQGGGLVAYGAAGSASQLPLHFIINGTTYEFPFSTGGVVGPGSTTSGDIALWANGVGTLLSDGPAISGINANTLRAVAANTPTTVLTSDCGKTIQMAASASSGFPVAITLPSVSGFPATCTVAFKNADTARGKSLSGFPADFAAGSTILWPNQYGTVQIINGAWATGVNPGIYHASSNITLTVNHASGVDANNDCLGTGSGACATLLHAWVLGQNVARPGATGLFVISNANEVFTESPSTAFLGPSLTAGGGGGVVFINGNGATWSTAGTSFDDGAVVSLSNFTMKCTGSGNYALAATKFGLVVLGSGMVFDTCPSGAHMQTFEGGRIVADSGYTVSAIGNYHIINNDSGFVTVATKAISVPNALTFTSWVSATGGAISNFTGTTFSGSGSGAGSTGSKYDAHNSAKMVFDATSLSQIPGATSGSLNTGACLNSTVCVYGTVFTSAGTNACSSATIGAITTITDSNTNTWGANIAGSGANTVLAYCNGSNWTVAGK